MVQPKVSPDADYCVVSPRVHGCGKGRLLVGIRMLMMCGGETEFSVTSPRRACQKLQLVFNLSILRAPFILHFIYHRVFSRIS